MVNTSYWKLIQKQTYDILSHKYGNFILLAGMTLIIVSAFQFGEVFLEWSSEKYAAVFNSFSDNLSGRSYQARLCLPVPIDVVFTWVNGSDPKLVAQVHRIQQGLEHELNQTKAQHSRSDEKSCRFTHCVAVPWLIVSPPLPAEVPLDSLSILYPAFSHATSTESHQGVGGSATNITLVKFETQEQVVAALKKPLKIKGQNATVLQAYLTSDWTIPNSVLLKDTVIMTGFPHEYDHDRLLAKLPESYRTAVNKMELFSDKGVAVMEVMDHKIFEIMVKDDKNFTIDNKEPTLAAASLVWDLTDNRHNEDISASRFEDNEELRYSLRSIEKFAPWVRHVYLVTNGQIPYWLNMDNQRLTVVSHNEIFVNKSHLPTFSSPAIESHLHRIPGLSDKFVYMNDDVMFGKPVWPDDFYTHANGQKVYLTWPVPDCQDGCPSSWIKDGYCDKACNNSECEWDGGDCLVGGSPGGQVQQGAGWAGQADSNILYCDTGCANNWLADRYCDAACNVYSCGYDVGDCGTGNFHKLHRIDINPNITSYKFPKGETVAYFNLTSLTGSEGSVEEATYDDNEAIRAATVAQKFKTLSLVLYKNHNTTVLHLSLQVKKDEDHTVKFDFNVSVNTMPVAKENKTDEVQDDVAEEKSAENKEPALVKPIANQTEEIVFEFRNISEELRNAKPVTSKDRGRQDISHDLRLYDLPELIDNKLQKLIESFVNGEMTEKGLDRAQAVLWDELVQLLKSEGKQPVRKQESEGQGQKHQIKEQGQTPVEDSEGQGQESDKNKAIDVPRQLNPKEEGAGIHKRHAAQDNLKAKRNLLAVELEETHKEKSSGISEVQASDTGFLPWEKLGIFDLMVKKLEALKESEKRYETTGYKKRHLLDTFGDSLRHVNKLFNQEFGYKARKVPAHMPHFIDKNIMSELQARFPAEWDLTSSHRVRHSKDMQFSFSYFYFMMHEPASKTVSDVFDEMDTDHSGILSDRELRTLATRLYEPPLDLQTLTGLENMFINCSHHLPGFYSRAGLLMSSETYYVKDMPQITKWLLNGCTPVTDLIVEKFPAGYKYRHETVSEDVIAFKMIKSNVSQVVAQLDDVRRNPKKFICLNDNIDHSNADQAKTVKAVLQDFYESMFPIPSSFELPREYRNRFLHIDELREWRKYRDWLKSWTYVALGVLILFTLGSFFSDKLEVIKKKIVGRRGDSPERKNGAMEVV